MDDLGHWTTELEVPEKFFGFLYRITNTTNGRMYIGKKQAKTMKKYPPLKGKKRSRRIEKDTDWRTYTGSSAYLNDDIERLGKDKFTFDIIRFGDSKSELAYLETYYIMVLHAVIKDEYYNGIVNIRIGGNCKLDIHDIDNLPAL